MPQPHPRLSTEMSAVRRCLRRRHSARAAAQPRAAFVDAGPGRALRWTDYAGHCAHELRTA